jgi:hypothetical protein
MVAVRPVVGNGSRKYHGGMAFPIKTCVVCEEEFELKPDKPGYANRCPECSSPEAAGGKGEKMSAEEAASKREADAARRAAIKDLLYSGK